MRFAVKKIPLAGWRNAASVVGARNILGQVSARGTLEEAWRVLGEHSASTFASAR